ncbi:alcohol dehydrogenase catalytic domain-containing protein [Streptomyces violaceusniger]|uniref:Alcohol dehydrogenase GroES domain protein n=1 Tax=Streptomyces violaceusniger (strain Tu 4113) TaxID=653045 RepID=G2PF30_STRV4|nr:alcohol dehydrogenase catalytic domain-containing protein [Streptomyces violaceusniger]AEM84036.1 Alcohol dehydrogenase GroES domain protein [Streptomyces violaceusniger Tu 4113]
MKALRYVAKGAPLQGAELADPVAGPGWVVVDVEAAGLCHSDVHVIDGMIKPIVRPPFTLGHEVAGTVSALGEGVEGYAIGDRVAVAIIAHPEVKASYAPGIGLDGGYAERLVAHASTLVPLPDNVSTVHAAVATDSVVTAYHAVRTEAQAKPGDVIAVVGLGGLGLNGVRTGVIAGATVYGVDINPDTFEAARAAGARECFTDVTALADLRPDAIVDFAGVGSTTSHAIDAVRRLGRVVVVGLGTKTTTFSTAASSAKACNSAAPTALARTNTARSSASSRRAGSPRSWKRSPSPTSTRAWTDSATARSGAAWSPARGTDPICSCV